MGCGVVGGGSVRTVVEVCSVDWSSILVLTGCILLKGVTIHFKEVLISKLPPFHPFVHSV